MNAEKLSLFGFNNLTKSLSFNIYDISYAQTRQEQGEYISYVDELYCSERLTGILQGVANIIGARVLNIASQDYEPQGASVTMLVEEGFAPLSPELESPVGRETVLAHLDKSHITVHTYPEQHPDEGISTFRVDIDVSTCGKISPLQALDFLIRSFDSDIVTIDYRIRGFTRTTQGKKLFIDHEIESIQDYIDSGILDTYESQDDNQPLNNCYHTRMRLRELVLDEYLFGDDTCQLPPPERARIEQRVAREIEEIYHGK